MKRLVRVLLCVFLTSFLFGCNDGNGSLDSKNTDRAFAKKIDKINLVSSYYHDECLDDFDSIEFGNYIQNENQPTPIEWVILERKNGEALLISKYVLDHKKFNEVPDDNITWETSSLRKWLNEDFFNNAFNDDEKK